MTVLIVVFSASVVFVGDAQAVPRGIRSGTEPVSSREDGLRSTPNPVDTSMNLVVTGHVGGGRHFRGIVPYQSVTEFGATVPSSSLDSFLRRSAGSDSFDGYGTNAAGTPIYGKAAPYYSTSSTVTTTMPGRSFVLRPPSAPILDAASSSYGSPVAFRTQDYFELGQFSQSVKFRPMTKTIDDLAKLLSSDAEKPSQPELQEQLRRTAAEQHAQEFKAEEFRRDLKELERKADEFALKLKSDIVKPPVPESEMDIVELVEAQKPATKVVKEDEADVYERMAQEINKVIELLAAQKKGVDKADEAKTVEKDEAERPAEISMSELMAAAKAKAILGEHKSFAAMSDDKFNEYLRAAETYLTQGRYYRAADAFTLASLYKPNDPLAYAGKSHALFAAGEYMSSALYLSQALEIFPEYALFKIDLATMIGDKDRVEMRMLDAADWVQKSQAGELYFLLAYVYLQMDREYEAAESISAAFEKMPDSKAVQILKKVIDGFAGGK